jgi:alkylation response protein AidB-like acyl-CoA dehydrogenase
MEFSFSEEQNMLRDLAREILEKEVTPELCKEVDGGDEWFHEGLWRSLAEANLLGLAVPEENGGMGFGMIELCVLLEEIGRTVAPLPVYPSLVLGGLPLAEFGTPEQKQQWLEGIATGETIFSGAQFADERGSVYDDPGVSASQEDAGWVLDGRRGLVQAARIAKRILVPARSPGGMSLFLVDPSAEGVSLEARRVTNREPVYELGLDRVRVAGDALLGGQDGRGAEILGWLRERATLATCALHVGVCERAIQLTADYVREREQFGVPIGSFQAVQHRLADNFMDVEAMRWTLWRAAWRIAEGLPAAREVAVAKFWAAEGGSRIVSSAQHLHGGFGVDLDYPIHRYFLWSKTLELNLGSATPQLARLGADMARTGPQESS